VRSAADFLEHFCLPLVRGGEALVGKPLTEAELEEMARQLPHASEPLVAIDEARTDVLAELVVRPPALVFDVDELLLAAAIHNLLFLSHPRTESWTVSEAAERRVLESAYVFASQPLSRGRTRILARHGLLHNLFGLRRTDIKLTWWTGSAEYFGQRPPPRLVTWKKLRRVREEVTVADFTELLGEPEITPVLLTLLRRSPLTQLLSIAADGPRLHWEDAAFLLRDPELARAIAYRSIEGDKPADRLVAPARLAAAFDQMLERGPQESDVRAVAAFLIYLAALLALDEAESMPRAARTAGTRSALLGEVLAPEQAGNRPRGLATFFALPAAAAQVDRELAEPVGLRDEPSWAARWDAHRAQAEEAIGRGVIGSLADRLRRHLERGP
jgi:hypothetical protein